MVKEAAPDLHRLPITPPQLLVELPLRRGDVSGHHHSNDADLVAATPGAEMGYPLPRDLDHAAGLGTGGQIDLRLAPHRGDRDPVSEHRLGDRDRQLVNEVLTPADQLGMGRDPEAQVEVTVRPALRSGLALA